MAAGKDKKTITNCQDDEAPQGNSGWQIYKIFDSLIT